MTSLSWLDPSDEALFRLQHAELRECLTEGFLLPERERRVLTLY
jgi:hypothetical protein